MRLTIQLKLQPTRQQADALQRTVVQANAACNAISQTAWNTRVFKQFGIHKLTYYDVKDAFGLSAQLTVRCIAKVADAYKLDRKTQRTFRPLGAIAFDDRILSYKQSAISIWTQDGRQTIPFSIGPRQRELLERRQGESDLAFVRGDWYLFITAEVEEPEPIDVDSALGIDLGVTNIAMAKPIRAAPSRTCATAIAACAPNFRRKARSAAAAACGSWPVKNDGLPSMSTTVSRNGLLRRRGALWATQNERLR